MTPPLTPRQRFRRIMAHQEADRVPLDLAGTSLTAIDRQLLPGLRRVLGISGEPERDDAPMDERVLEALDIDFRRVGDLIASGSRPLPGKPGHSIDSWGVTRAWTGQYHDIVDSPLRGASIDDLDSFPWPDPAEVIDERQLERFRERARRLYEQTDYVIVAEHPVYGVFELGCWMCGFDDMLLRMAGDVPFVMRLFAKLLALQKAFIAPYYQAIGEFVHLTTSGDDFGTQTGPFVSPRAFRTLIKPYFTERIAFTRQFSDCHFWHHSCGSVHSLLPDLLEAGVEILNPVQPGAWRMEPDRLKADFGQQVTFHGGFDTQNVLPFGSQQEIETEVRRVMDALKPNGGYIFSAAHNIQADVPPQNVATMFRAAQRFGRYGKGDG